MKLRMGLILVFSLLTFTLYGCANFSGNNDSSAKFAGVLEPSTTLKFSDVPVPLGFKILPKDSYTFESSGVRVGVLKYQGKATPDQVVNFYKEQMLMYNWSLLNVGEYGERLMNFDRDNETCIIDLAPKGSSVILTISLGPKSQVAKKPKQPLK